MDWNQTFTILISLFGLILWVLREMKSDKASVSASIEKLSEEIKKESRDFHGRLSTLEEKYIQMMQRFMERK
jgi:hypothetical protein